MNKKQIKAQNQTTLIFIARISLFAIFFAVLFLITSLVFYVSLRFGINDKNNKSESRVNMLSLPSLSETAVGQELYNEAILDLPTILYISDLSDYEEFINPSDKDEYLILINTNNSLDKNYIPDDMVDVVDTRKDAGRKTQLMRKYAAKALEAMLIELRASGFKDVTVTSAYRSYEYQESLFNARVASYSSLSYEAAYAKAATIIAIPGTSEHQSGLCADLHNLPSADVSFKKQPAFKWLEENCHNFGFILRFPEDKTEITSISFEPWHYRYVGRYHATKMFELGLCLEEYMEY